MNPLCKISLFAFALLVVASCGSNKENEEPQPENDLVGTWTSVSQTSKAMVGTMTYSQALVGSGTIFGGDPAWAAQMESIAIQANNLQHTMYFPEIKIENAGKFTASSGTSNAGGTWTLSADEKILNLSLDGGSREMTGTITKLTSTDLWIEVKLNQSDPLGFLPTYTFSSVMKYTRK